MTHRKGDLLRARVAIKTRTFPSGKASLRTFRYHSRTEKMLDDKIKHLPLEEYKAALPATLGFYAAHEIEAGEPHELYGSEPFAPAGEVVEVVCTRAAKPRGLRGKGRGQLVVVRRPDGRCAYFDARVAKDLFEEVDE